MRVKLAQVSILNLRTDIDIYILHHHILIILRGHSYTVMVYALRGLRVLKRRLFEAYEGDEFMIP